MNVECSPIIEMPLWAQMSGYAAALLTIIFPIPQAYSIIKHQTTPKVSITTWIATALRGLMWVPFGVGFAIRGKRDDAITMIGSNMIAALICIFIIILLKRHSKPLYQQQQPATVDDGLSCFKEDTCPV